MFKKKSIKIIIIIAILAAGGVSAYFIAGKKPAVEYTTAKVERGNLIQTVSETGTVKASSEINLNFLNSGRIAKINVKVGDKMEKDQVLAELDYGSLKIKEREARANLNKLLAGATRTEIAVAEASERQAFSAYAAAQNELEKVKNSTEESIAQAEKTLADLESDLPGDITVYEQAITVAETSLKNTKKTYEQSISNKKDIVLTTIDAELADGATALDDINTIINDSDTDGALSVKNTNYLNAAKYSRSDGALLLSSAKSDLAAAKTEKTEENINKAFNSAKDALDKIFAGLNNIYDALEASVTSSNFTQAELDAYKTTISGDQTTISVSISNIQTAKQNLDDARLAYDTNVSNAEKALMKARVDYDNAVINARNALNTARVSGEQQVASAQAKIDSALEAWEVAKAQSAKTKAPARNEDIILQQATLDSVKKQIEDSIIKAPIAGTITKINYEIGEQTSASQAVISMVAENNFEIEVDISEADIAKVSVNNPVEITLDAFGDDLVFPGVVSFLEPAETVIQDVTYYKTKIDFIADANEYKENFKNIKPGMTTNVIITTMEKNNVLIMPARAVAQKNGDRIVSVLINGQIEERPVSVGLRGDGGLVEILSGVKEEEEVVTFVRGKN